ncbi:MAG TPA: glycosyltransferase [Gemmatimonadaceae bacterium]
MPAQGPVLSLIIPVFNGADRLPSTLSALREFLCTRDYSWELILVDDCSAPATTLQLLAFRQHLPGVIVLRNERNRGKGHSVARGMLAATGAHRVFTDADLAYPLTEIERILAALQAGADIAIACRVLPESRYLMSPSFFSYLYTRHIVSRAFNLLVRLMLVPGLLDTQAGLKGFSAEAAEAVFAKLTTPGFGFDVEALFVARLRGFTIVQTPVCFRYDEEPTTVRFVEDALRMARDLVRIRWNWWRGRYD